MNTQLFRSLAALLAIFLFGCNQRQNNKPANPVVSSAPIEVGRPFTPVPQIPRPDISYGEGDCAPRFENGMRGTCINNQPCNGFGFKDANGKIQCACFDKVGGCETNMGCSLEQRRCVPLKQLDRKAPSNQR